MGYKTPQLLDNQDYVPGKTAWDLLELLIVPAALALTALWFSNRERKDDREIATDRQQEAALQAYYVKMSELLLEKNLREAEKGDEVVSIARSMTLATLRSLDGTRKGMVIKFLYETKLIDKSSAVVHLYNADLIQANLVEAILSGADLSRVYLGWAGLSRAGLSRANLSGAILQRADLREADLSGGDLSGADLSGANLSGANLYQVDLSSAKLSEAQLNKANLNRADLGGADLSEANLGEADLREAKLGGARLCGADLSRVNLSEVIEIKAVQLSKAKTLFKATMMDGKRYDPAVHTEIARLRKESGLDDGNKPPENL